MFHKSMMLFDANVLVRTSRAKSGKDIWVQHSYRSVFENIFQDKSKPFYSKNEIISYFDQVLGVNKYIITVKGKVVSTLPRCFVLDMDVKQLTSYRLVQEQLEKGMPFILSDRLDCVDNAKEEFYDIYVKVDGEYKSIHTLFDPRDVRPTHRLENLLKCLLNST